ncbi:tryptophan 2,3-dioxygenase [Emcibacter nanhaiensis]|uniref:Tryptophan 2,3-dioxygenase n=1 Tax=Emcibacter nanhaiensis TaxID=1505037 RepID=A0A501PTP5_9PROT|nr:tryptophan 2,3-dioxygenase [Emcibacter nanhaiensis]TPD63146.1 tryptophan 2,3-dioxygenase [Emcibacter nanhaiensis]
MSETYKPGAVDLTGEDIHWDQDVSYGQYLGLDKLLDCQTLRSDQHDEMMFIIIHQASELWMKLSIHELTGAMEQIRRDELGPAFKMISRIARIQEQLIQSWNILATMTPSDYLKFRDSLGQSSGFQSYQYRIIEFSLGNKNPGMVEVHKAHPEIYRQVRAALDTPSIYDLTLKLLYDRGFNVPTDKLSRDWSEPYVASAEVEQVWQQVYAMADKYWDLYELAEKLVDLEHRFQSWRFSHLKTVERVIGYRRGTGGTGGVSYLSKALELQFFPELWSVRTSL